MFKRIGILAHPHRTGAGPVGELVHAALHQRGLNSWLRTSWDTEALNGLIPESDLMIAIGGDGAMLRTARVCAPFNVPVFGINTGHLGFLTEARGDDWEPAIDALLNGQYWIEHRMMIASEAWHGDERLGCFDALNDVVISRGLIAHSVLLETYIDGDWATTYAADGLIVATPTGSTAYAMAVGGPILPPELKNILVVPVAPHLSMDRPMVLSEGATIEVVIAPETQTEVTLTVDGELTATLHNNDCVIVRASDRISHFVRMRDRNYFYRSLLDRLEPRVPLHHEPSRRAARLTAASENNRP
jgi:NAD+ kinase